MLIDDIDFADLYLRTGYRIAGAGGQTHDDLWR